MTRLSRNAKIIGFISLLSDVSTEMAYPLLPAFITQVIGAPVSALGFIEGLAGGTSSFATGLSGWISDRIGRRKRVAIVGYAITAVSKPVIAAATGWLVVLGARLADRLGKGIRSAPRDALLAESSHQAHRGRAFGYERAMDSSGAVLGPLLTVAIMAWTALGPRAILLLSTIPAAGAVMLILFVRERREELRRGSAALRLSLTGAPRQYKRLLFIVGVFGLANSANAFPVLRSQQLGLAVEWTVLAYSVYNVIAAIAAMPAGALSDRIGRRRVLTLGYVVYAGVYVGFGLAGEAWLAWPLFAAYGLFPALTEGIAKALALDTAGDLGHATAVGVLSSVVGLTQLGASLIAGSLWDLVSPQATFYFGAVVAAIAALLLVFLLPEDEPPQGLPV